VKRILYLFDDINYTSGAQKAMFLQMEALRAYYQISVFSLTRPQPGILPEGVVFGEMEICGDTTLFARSFREVVKDRAVPPKEKICRIIYGIQRRFGQEQKGIIRFLTKSQREWFESFFAVVVVSEASKLRWFAAGLKKPKKIQWIHTDYVRWSSFSGWTRAVSRQDGKLYKKFDTVVTLSEANLRGLLFKLPELREKSAVVPNLIDADRILHLAGEKSDLVPDKRKCNFITVGRLEEEKNYDRILDFCARLRKDGKKFCWYIVGEGSLKNHLEGRIVTQGLEEYVKLTGRLENPYPLMAGCNYLVLPSKYEGTPVTVDEAMVLGLPVIAADVGGIREQLGRGEMEGEKDIFGEVVRGNWYARLSEMAGDHSRINGAGHFACGEFNQHVLKSLLKLFAD
jgi:glycosyltransferase involved in cell wall biosynthesis